MYNRPVRRSFFLVVLLITALFVLSGCSSAGTVPPPNPSKTEESDRETSNALIKNTPRLLFSHDSGVYEQNWLEVTLTAPKGYTIAYTTDGSFPTAQDDSSKSVVRLTLEQGTTRYLAEHAEFQIMKDFSESALYDDPDLPSGVMLSAALVDSEGTVGEPEIKVFYLGLDFDKLFPGCLVLSVFTNPSNLLDYDYGILSTGAVYDSWRKTKEGKEVIANHEWHNAESNSTQHGREWERPCVIQIYDGKSAPSIEEMAGIRTQGGLARRANQKSFNFYFRSEYGAKRLNYELFPGIKEFKSFSLRSGGNNYDRLKYKDALLQDLVSDRDVTVASFRPAVLFLNGEYWGPYMLTEKVSGQMIHDHFGVESDQVVVIKNSELEVGKESDLLLYNDLMSFAERDLTKPEIYQEFCSVVNVQSMADYFATQIYIGNADWKLDKNFVLWRTRDASYQGGRWQFFLHDIEFSSGMYSSSSTAPEKDHFKLALKQFPLFASAIQNKEFYSLFLKALVEIGSENYSYEKVEASIQRYDEMWRPMMDDFYKRFGSPSYFYDSNIEVTLNFFLQRYNYIVPLVQKS